MVSVGDLTKYDGKFTQESMSYWYSVFLVLKISSAFSDP